MIFLLVGFLSPCVTFGQKGKAGVGLFVGSTTYGNGDSNPLPDKLAYRFNWVTRSGFEGNLSLGSQTLGQRFWMTEKVYVGLHAGMSIMNSRVISYGPSAHFSAGMNLVCLWICLTPEISSGLGINPTGYGTAVVPMSTLGLGITTWW
jgi:hypothetical protein